MAKQRDPYASLRSYRSEGSGRSSSGKDAYSTLDSYKSPTKSQAEKDEEEKRKRQAELEKKKQESKKSVNLANLGSTIKKGAGKAASFLFSGTEKALDSVEALTGGFDRKQAKLTKDFNEKKIDNKTYQEKLKAIEDDIKWAGTKSNTKERIKKSVGVGLEAATEIVPIGVAKGAKAASKGRRIATAAGETAAMAGAGSVGSQLVENGRVDAKKTLADIAAGGLFGAGVSGAGMAASKGLKNVKEKVPFVHANEGIITTKSMGEVKKKKADTLADLQKSLVDRNAPVSDYVNKLQKNAEIKLAKDKNPAELLKLRAGVEGQAATHVKDTIGWVSEVPKDIRADGDSYGYAKQFLSQADKRTPEQIEKAQKTIEVLTQRYGGDTSVLENYTQKMRQSFDSLVDVYQREGILSKAHADKLRANPDYFAKMEVLQDETERVLRNSGSVNVKESGMKGIKGQGKDAQLATSPEAFVKQTMRVMQDVANNRIGRSLGELADSVGESDIIKRLSRESVKIPKGFTRITYIDQGKKNFVAVPEEIGKILTGADQQTFDIVTKTIGSVHNIFRQAVTTYNPLFVFLRNPIRDFKSFTTNSRYVPVHRALDNYASALMDSLTGGKWKDEFLRAGGGQAGYFSQEGGQAGKQIAAATRKATTNRSLAGKIVTSPRDFMQYMSEAIEAAPRVAEFRGAKKAGMSDEAAAIAGREVTVDFAQGGSVARVANQWIPFLNARAQGIRRTGQAFKENPKRALTVWAATGIVPMAAAMAWNNQFRDVWENIPDYEKENNFIIITGRTEDGKGDFIKIPKGDVDKILGNTFETMLDSFMKGGGDAAKQLQQALISGASNLSPISFASGGDVSASSVMSGILPPVAKAPVEVASNYSFFKDSPIVPESMQGAPENEQVRDNTPGLAKLLGGALKTSPMVVENTVNNLAGNVPFDIANALSLDTSSANRMKRGVVSESSGKTETEFWKVYSPAKKTRDYRESQIYDLINQGKFKEAQRKADEYNRDVDNRFNGYFKEYGAYMPDAFENGSEPIELIDNLKIDVQISKKGKPYIKR
jgi:hypothetical protein